jgi:hypothetical protein
MRWWIVPLLAVGACKPHAAERDASEVAAPVAIAVDAAPPCPGTPALCAACAAGAAASCTEIAKDLPDVDKRDWYQRGCDGGDLAGCEGLSWYHGFVVHDHRRFLAAEEQRLKIVVKRHASRVERCAESQEEACMEAAFDVENGQGVPADVPAGLALLVASCDRGYARSCMSIAQEDRASAAERARYGRVACKLGEERTCGALLGVFGHPPLDAAAAGFARGELDRMCKARDSTACWVLAGWYWTRDRAKAAAAIAAGCAVDPGLCEYKNKLARGETFLPDLGPIPTLDLQPLVDAAKRRR